VNECQGDDDEDDQTKELEWMERTVESTGAGGGRLPLGRDRPLGGQGAGRSSGGKGRGHVDGGEGRRVKRGGG
jgi:hypothetical protein